MSTAYLSKVNSIRKSVHQLRDDTSSPFDAEQIEDINNILNAIELLEQRVSAYNKKLIKKADPMLILHDLTSPISGIIGYLYILKQEYTSPLSRKQHELIAAIEAKAYQLHDLINTRLLTHPDL